MLETMYTAPGIGLAATQVDVHERFMVIDVTEARDQPLVFINPVLRHRTEPLREHQEGCLPIPGIFADVTRADGIEVEAPDRPDTDRKGVACGKRVSVRVHPVGR